MAPFYPVYARRSDGKLHTKKSGNAKDAQDPNEPLPEQLVTKPNAQGIADFYRLCQPGHSKEVDWRKKLAGMLMREIGDPELQDRNFILSALPENYRLYEHIRIKTTDKEGNPAKNKTHAGGGNERQDAYLYGHPQGRKKRYRSPADFFPHLLWLCTDEAGDPNNCSCRFCSPEEIEVEGDAEGKASKQAKTSESKSEGQLPSRKSSQTSASANSTSNLPRIRSSEQKVDMDYNKFLYRPGEVVWFQRGQAWGLGAIVQRSVLQLAPQKLQYRVQPLSHPMTHPQSVSCMQDQIRNWLAWSPPPCITPELNPNPKNSMKAPTYDEVDWRTFLTGKVSPTDAEVDGSILAAKAVESTYTLFELLGSTVSNPSSAQTSERTFQGLYLGSEKIWVGDPLRLRSPNTDANVPANEILILHSIAERQHPEDSSRSAVLLTGDVYTPATAPNGSPVIPKDLSNLPLRVQSDLAAGNAIAAASRITHYLRLTSKGATFSLTDIKGRWYESSVIMPILAPVDYESSKRKGELGDASLWMNGHGDCNRLSMSEKGHRAAWVRCKKREEAFGRSVPASFKLFPTVEEPPNPGSGPKAPNNAVRPPMNSMAYQPLQQQQQQQQQQRPVQQQRQASQGQTQQQYAQQAPNQILQQQQPTLNQAQQHHYHHNSQQPQPQPSIPPHQQPFAFSTAQPSALSTSGQQQQQQQQQQPNQGPESTFDDLMDYDGAVSEATGRREAQEDGLGGFASEFDTQGYEGFGVG